MKKFNFREGRVYRQDRIIFEISNLSKYEISDRKNELAHLHSRNLWPTVRVNDPFSLDLIAVRRSKLCPAFYPTERRGTRIYSLPHNLVIHRRDFYRRAVIDAPLVVIVLSFSPSWRNEGKEKRKKERKRRREKKRHRWKDGRERERERIFETQAKGRYLSFSLERGKVIQRGGIPAIRGTLFSVTLLIVAQCTETRGLEVRY